MEAAAVTNLSFTGRGIFQPQRGNLLNSRALCSSLRSPHRRPQVLRVQPVERDYVSYEGDKSVFPAEACEELGGDSCAAEGVGQEVKPKAAAPSSPTPKAELPDRDYEEYADKKTVFPGEACDELGGEFCEPEYQKGVFPEKAK